MMPGEQEKLSIGLIRQRRNRVLQTINILKLNKNARHQND